jgi:hypothetical protein
MINVGQAFTFKNKTLSSNFYYQLGLDCSYDIKAKMKKTKLFHIFLPLINPLENKPLGNDFH